MARPRKDESEKKMQLNIRVKPATKRDLEAYADEEGCTVSAKAEQLIEAMLKLSDGADEETIDLLSDIVAEIQTVQSITKGKWHNDLATWAAVSEVFKGSPIKKKKPSDSMDDAAVQKAWTAYMEIVREKQSLIMMMQKFGISINDEPKRWLTPRGLFGKAHDHRAAERQKIAEIADADERNKAETIFSMIEDADERGKAALKVWEDASEPYRQQESEGRKIYKDYRRKIALDVLSKGGFPDIEDL